MLSRTEGFREFKTAGNSFGTDKTPLSSMEKTPCLHDLSPCRLNTSLYMLTLDHPKGLTMVGSLSPPTHALWSIFLSGTYCSMLLHPHNN